LDAKDLKVFEAVARFGGMKRAALELNTVQSNVTARIRQLESYLGVPLFERRPNGMKLTPAGVRLLPYAFEVRAAIANAKRAISDIGTPRGQLLIGSRKTTASIHMTAILSSYITAYPDVDVRIRAETSPLLKEMVIERKLEGAFVCDPIDHHDLVTELIFDEELVVYTAPYVTELRALPPDCIKMIVLGQGSLYEKQLEAVLTRQGFTTTRVMELGSLEGIMSCVSAGLGVTLLPRSLLNSGAVRDQVRAHSVTDENCRVQTIFIRRRDSYFSSALSAFLDCVRSYAKNAGT
jgi:DNA-binding transcriptional LysR family regulator